MTLISFDFEDQIRFLDPQDPRVAAAMLHTFLGPVAVLVETITGNPAKQQLDQITSTFSTALDQLQGFSPQEAPSFQAWLYRIAWRKLLGGQPKDRRRNLKSDMPGLLARLPFALNVIEIAYVLNRRENKIAARIPHNQSLPDESPQIPFPEIDLELVLSRITSRVTTPKNPRESRFHVIGSWRELSWLVVAALVVLGVISLSTRSLSNDQGPALFPTTTPQLPMLIEVDQSQVISAPELTEQATQDNIQNIEPILSDDGRFVVFSSSSPFLVAGDTNESMDVFVFEIASGTVERVSVTTSGVQADGFSFSADISSDGRYIVFASNAGNLAPGNTSQCEQVEFWGTCSYIFRHDRQTGETQLVSSWRDGSPLDYPSILPVISGDGAVVAFWSFRGFGQNDTCKEADEEVLCADLYIKDLELGVIHQLKVGKSFFDYSERLSIGGPLDLVGFHLEQRDESFARLNSPNESEVVLYDWRGDEFRLLNVAPDGSPGNGDSYLPVIARDGSTAIFVSKASNLTANDTNNLADVFSYDLSSGRVRSESVTNDGDIGDGESGIIVQPVWNSRIHISKGSRFSLFISNAKNLIDTNRGVWCGYLGGQFWDCYALLVHDRELGTTRQIEITDPMVFGPWSQIYYPSISEDGRYISFMSIDNEYDYCAPKGCADIWVLDRTAGEFILASPDMRLASTEEGPWTFQASLPGHRGWTNDLTYGPSGKLVTGGQDGRVQVFEPNGSLLFDLQEHYQAVTAVAVSPEGRYLAAGSMDGSVVIWDFDDGAALYNLDGQPGQIMDLSFSPDGHQLAVGSQKSLWFYEVQDGQFFKDQELPQSNVRALAFTPDGKYLAAASQEEIWLRDTQDGGVLTRLAGHLRNVLDVAFSPDGDLLATASEDGNVNLWDLYETGAGLQLSYRFSLHHADWVYALAFSPTEPILVSGTFDSAINIWSTSDGAYLDTLHRSNQDQVLALAFSPDGQHLAAGTVRGIRLWTRKEASLSARRQSEYFRHLDSDTYIEHVPYIPSGLRGITVPLEFSENLQTARENAPFEYARLSDMDGSLTLAATAFINRESAGFDGVVQIFLYSTSYQPALLTLVQSESNPMGFDLPIGLTAQVRTIPLEARNGELVLGGWSFSASSRFNAQYAAVERTWSDEAASIWLRWRQEGWYFSLYFDQPFNSQFVIDSEKLTLDKFLELADEIILP